MLSREFNLTAQPVESDRQTVTMCPSWPPGHRSLWPGLALDPCLIYDTDRYGWIWWSTLRMRARQAPLPPTTADCHPDYFPACMPPRLTEYRWHSGSEMWAATHHPLLSSSWPMCIALYIFSCLRLRQWPVTYLITLSDWIMSCQPGRHAVVTVCEPDWKIWDRQL